MRFLKLSPLLIPTLATATLPEPPPPSQHGTLQLTQTPNITTVTISNPPLNLVDRPLISDLHDLMLYLRSTPSDLASNTKPKLVIFKSANPTFFMSHLDLTLLTAPITPDKLAAITQYSEITRFLQNITSTVFIAAIDGHAFGAGHELALQMDMRFAGPNALSGSIENTLGLTAGGGGELFLGTLTNRGRALEYLLAAKGFDAPTGTRVGLWNEDYADAETLYREVESLAGRIAVLPGQSLNQTKSALGFLNPSLQVQVADVEAFNGLAGTEVAQRTLDGWLKVSEGQEAGAFELGLPDSIFRELY